MVTKVKRPDTRFYCTTDGTKDGPVCPSLTKQADLVSSDINHIMKRFGGIPQQNPNIRYGDATIMPDDLLSAHLIVQQAESAFASLDAHVRSHFENDPVKFLEFMSNPNNGAEAIKLGLATKVANPDYVAPAAPPVVPPGAAPVEPQG